MMLRITDRLDDETEDLVHRVIGCCLRVHQGLGPGLRERMYLKAVEIELGLEAISFCTERSFPVIYREHVLNEQRVDLIAGERVLVEVKAIERLAEVHWAQVLCYLHVTHLPIGLLMNFNEPVLNVRRVVLSEYR